MHNTLNQLTMIIVCALMSLNIQAQTKVKITPNIRILKNSAEQSNLINSLNHLLSINNGESKNNQYILKKEYIETKVLLDQIKNIEQSKKYGSEHFYQPYLTNIIQLNDEQYFVQISFIGFSDSIPYLRASIRIKAHKAKEHFVFSSFLKTNTKNWEKAEYGNFTFYYKDSIQYKTTSAFLNSARTYDEKLKLSKNSTIFYCTKDRTELHQLIGLDYKLDYNGWNGGTASAQHNSTQLTILANDNEHFSSFDPHDLWHDRLSLIVPRNQVNHSIDEGCAYLYGGSWGLTWEEIYSEFYDQIAKDKNTDWLKLKENPVYFKTSNYKNSADFIVNALLIQEIEKKHGFEGVWEFLNIGPEQKGNSNYYLKLEQLLGINKDSYNNEIWKLVTQEYQKVK